MNQERKIYFNHPTNVQIPYILETAEREGYELVITDYPIEDIESIIEASKGCSAIIVGNETWDAKAIDAICGHIRIMMKYAVGVNNIDVAYATKVGMPVFNIAGMNAIPVAETAMMHILNGLRKFVPAVGIAKSGFQGLDGLFGNDLSGKTVGLVGFGNIARNVCRMLSGFAVRVYAYDKYIPDEVFEQNGAIRVESLEDLFCTCDVISVHVPLTKDTEGLIDAKLFSVMKDGAGLVNTSRGGVINEDDLYTALCQKKLSWAGLDVVRDEPLLPTNRLLALENAYITPHYAACSVEAEQKVQEALVKTISCYLKGERFGNLVNPDYVKHLR